VRLDITTPPSTEPVSLAISPDGQRIVFVATSEGRSRLSLRSLDANSARPLAGTELASYPFWSPDGRSIGFFADGKLKVIDVDSRSVRTVASASSGQGGTWNRDGVILFAPNISSQIWRVSASGGEPAPVTRMEPRQTAQRYPQFLPDGGRFLYYVTGSSEVRGVYVGQINASESRRLFESEAAAVYESSGHLLFVSQGMLLAQRFDPVRLALTGNPLPVADQVAGDWRGRVALSASAAGPMVYRAGSTLVARQFVWLDRSGKEVEKVGEPDSTIALSPSISPDGRLVAMHRLVNGNADIFGC
jgi:Tol biopolymer transport system component